jgi:hypothetical protein
MTTVQLEKGRYMQYSQDPTPSDFLRAVEAGYSVKDTLRAWWKRRTAAKRVSEIKENLFADDNNQTSGSMRISSVMRAVQAEEQQKPKLSRIHLQKTGELPKISIDNISHIADEPTMLIPVSRFPAQSDYHVVNERGREFSLKIRNDQCSTCELMEMAVNKCRDLIGYYPSCIFVKFERLLSLNQAMYDIQHFLTRDMTPIPFKCAEDGADYDIKVIHDRVAPSDQWLNEE